ncbi:MAG: SH3 domain-containing protein [Methylocystis sp.]
MLSRFIPVLAGAAILATAGSAFAFDAMVTAPTAMRTHASPRAAVIEVIPARAVIDMTRCAHGWCEAAYAGQMGYVHTPVLVSAGPTSAYGGGPMGMVTAPISEMGTVVGAVVTAPEMVMGIP